MMNDIEIAVRFAEKQAGDEYVLGAEVDPTQESHKWDCSELTERSAHEGGLYLPDGAYNQYLWCRQHGTIRPYRRTELPSRGELLFVIKGARAGNGRGNHVAWAASSTQTIEARNKKLDVGKFPIAGRPWTHVGRVPGAHYPASGPNIATPPPSARPVANRPLLAWGQTDQQVRNAQFELAAVCPPLPAAAQPDWDLECAKGYYGNLTKWRIGVFAGALGIGWINYDASFLTPELWFWLDALFQDHTKMKPVGL